MPELSKSMKRMSQLPSSAALIFVTLMFVFDNIATPSKAYKAHLTITLSAEQSPRTIGPEGSCILCTLCSAACAAANALACSQYAGCERQLWYMIAWQQGRVASYLVTASVLAQAQPTGLRIHLLHVNDQPTWPSVIQSQAPWVQGLQLQNTEGGGSCSHLTCRCECMVRHVIAKPTSKGLVHLRTILPHNDRYRTTVPQDASQCYTPSIWRWLLLYTRRMIQRCP